jgi:hypothetical protein
MLLLSKIIEKEFKEAPKITGKSQREIIKYYIGCKNNLNNCKYYY